MTNAIARILEVAMKILIITVYFPSTYTIRPMIIEEIKYNINKPRLVVVTKYVFPGHAQKGMARRAGWKDY